MKSRLRRMASVPGSRLSLPTSGTTASRECRPTGTRAPATRRGPSLTPLLRLAGITKRYGRVVAIDGSDLELYPGEILAVIGDNGAGKSSLIKALSGALIPDEGEIFLDGEQVHFRSPMDARGMTWQKCQIFVPAPISAPSST